MEKKLLVVLFLIIVVFTGCEKYDITEKGNPNYPIISPFPERTQEEITLYFPDSQLRHLTQEVRKIEKGDNDNIEKIVLQELMRGTQKKGLKNIIPRKTKLISIDLMGETAYINFSNGILNRRMTEKEEAFLLYSIVNTVTELETINDVQILIDGVNKEVLNKHYRISEPLKKSTFIAEIDYISPISIVRSYYDSLINKEYGKAINRLSMKDNNELSYSTIESYIKNYYQDLISYEIKDYIIDDYNRHITLVVVMRINSYKKNQEENIKKDFTLIYEDNQFKIRNILG